MICGKSRGVLLAALAALALGSACAKSTAGALCSSDVQCGGASICFLGECRNGASSLSTVSAEVRPPNDSRLSLMQRGQINLRSSTVVDFPLQPAIAVSGVVTSRYTGVAAPVTTGTVVFTDSAANIVDRIQRVSAPVDASGAYSVRLPASTWTVQVIPEAPYPAARYPTPVTSSAAGLELPLPPPDQLVRVEGTLLAGTSPLVLASVTAVDAEADPVSTPVKSDADGGFALLLPPGPPSYQLQVGPIPQTDGGDPNPLPSFALTAAFSSGGPLQIDLAPLTPPAVLSGKVVDSSGAPLAGARVYAVSLDDPGAGPRGWVLSRSTSAAADGTFSLTLREGPYAIEAAPLDVVSQPALSPEQVVSVGAKGASVTITCPAKSQALGLLTRPDGTPVGSGFQITATRLADRFVSGRTASATPTDGTGTYHLTGDSGQYRLEIVPPSDLGAHLSDLPRKIVTVMLGAPGPEAVLPTVQLSPPLEVVGTVHGPLGASGSDGPVAGATVDFYALDASGRSTVRIGGGLTDARGHYRVVLPDVSQPASDAATHLREGATTTKE